jgi:hypothetical protein
MKETENFLKMMEKMKVRKDKVEKRKRQLRIKRICAGKTNFYIPKFIIGKDGTKKVVNERATKKDFIEWQLKFKR